MKDYLEVVPLGGLGEFGMNCCAMSYGDDMILIDAGISFPGASLGGLGVGLIVPDIEYLKQNRDKLRAIILTHGHEDHAGAVSYLIDQIPVPVYGSALTLGLVSHRLKERNLLQDAVLETIEARQILRFGPFEIEPLYLTHSFPDSFAFAITTPVGRLIWTGDFKFDPTPIDQKISDMTRLSECGEEGVLALFSDSTNSDRDGLSPSEFSVIEPLRTLFRRAKAKILVSCFASSLHRIQIILDLAEEFHRKVLPAGRSMVSNLRIARELGYVEASPDLFITAGESREMYPDQILVLASGTQGEPMSALSRLAVNEFKNVFVEEGDFVIMSARIIPGNERLISNLVNHFYRRGAEVFDSRHAPIHASGHGFQADLKLMMNLTRPQFFIPIHGEYRQLKNHAQLAEQQGITRDRIRVVETGDILQISSDSAEINGAAPVGRRLLDDGRRKEVDEIVVRDRRFLSEDGFLVVVLRIDRFNGKIIGEPELVSRGLVPAEASEVLTQEVSQLIQQIVDETPVEEKQDEEVFREILIKRLKRFIRKQTGKRPVILPMMLEI